jgi:hypothetical protein
MLTYEFHTNDENLKDLTLRYWAVTAVGAWVETTEALTTAKSIPKSQLTKIVNATATTYLNSVTCADCGSLATVLNRTNYKKLISESINPNYRYTCTSCLLQKRDQRLQQHKDLEAAKKHKIEAVLDGISDRKFDFSNLSFSEAVYCYSIRQASGFDSEIGAIRTENLFIVPNSEKKTEVFTQLYTKGILTISKNSPISAFDLGDNGVTYSPEKVVWTFASDSKGYDDEVISQFILDSLARPDAETLCDLWHEVAQQECEAYFGELCDRYRFSNWTYTETVAESIDYVLQKFSIPQVWGLMYGEFKGLAALVQAGTHNRRHIENMFSGNMRRRSDRWIANNWDAKHWSRRPFEKESYLTSLLFDNLFGGGNQDWDSITLSNVKARAEQVLTANKSPN